MVGADTAAGQAVPAKKSDLPVRVASAPVMLAVAGFELWLGGVWLDSFIAAVALLCWVEFIRLVSKATKSRPVRLFAMVAGAVYIGLAAFGLASMELYHLTAVIGIVVSTDTCAYFAGRTIGGPKIAPSISPSKTWAGLLGGMTGSAVWLVAYMAVAHNAGGSVVLADDIGIESGEGAAWAVAGAVLAIAAQAGDFFESWLKRRAGVKDSSKLIPGHGGVFDRVDGLLPVALIVGLLTAVAG